MFVTSAHKGNMSKGTIKSVGIFLACAYSFLLIISAAHICFCHTHYHDSAFSSDDRKVLSDNDNHSCPLCDFLGLIFSHEKVSPSLVIDVARTSVVISDYCYTALSFITAYHSQAPPQL